MLNEAFLSQQRSKMRGERNFSFEVSSGEDQTLVFEMDSVKVLSVL